MASVFVYRPLNSAAAEIRLVRILPSSPHDTSDLIHCQLQHVSLLDSERVQHGQPGTALDWDGMADAPSTSTANPEWRYTWGDFVALSYTWGNPSETRDIAVDGLRVQVRSNLEAALRALAKKRPVQQGILLWIDALCINQGDIGERNREVKRMRAIYQTARDVVVWLGEESDDSGMAMKFVKRLAESCADGTDDVLGRELRTSPEMFVGAWRAIGQLFTRPYWERLWIIQEIAMGNSQTPVLCGDATVRWGHIYHGIYTFGSRHIDIFFSNIERECREGGVRYAGLNRNKLIHLWREGEVQAGKQLPQFLPMLDLGRKSAATDPRDKVYGLLGLMPPEVAASIEPDYEKPIPEVYLSLAKTWVTTSK